jgi:hypothetical protein
VADSWISFAGSKELLDRFVEVLFYRGEERTRRQGEAMSAQGKGAQELLKAAEAMTEIEQKRLKLIVDKIDVMRRLGMTEEIIASMAKTELSRLERIAQALDVLQRHTQRGTMIDARVDEPPP